MDDVSVCRAARPHSLPNLVCVDRGHTHTRPIRVHALAATLALFGMAYGVIGVVRLGVAMDVALLSGAGALERCVYLQHSSGASHRDGFHDEPWPLVVG